ncbi:MAG: flagellin lysine-N-methylase [Clostridia bacterium]|nr:flagellin lysine-N-methylase [Clostridia bacterium]
MKIITPDYYQNFKCIADRCRHSCCIGWEIEVDPLTLGRYQSIPDVRTHITPEGTIALVGERCPFLNERGLCNIICTYGEEALCRICTDHPRFRNFYSDRIEVGLGLCCEAAAELILSYPSSVKWTSFEGAPLPEERAFFALRQQIFDILQDRTRTVDERVEKMLALCGAELPEKTSAEWTQIYLSLEQLDPVWRDILLAEPRQKMDDPLGFEQLLVYFIYRHLADALEEGGFRERVLFAALSYQMIRQIWSANPELSLQEIARMYSAEIEYSDENMKSILNLFV